MNIDKDTNLFNFLLAVNVFLCILAIDCDRAVNTFHHDLGDNDLSQSRIWIKREIPQASTIMTL